MREGKEMLIEQTGRRRVIVYGLGNTVWDAIDYIRLRFQVVGCSDGNAGKAPAAERMGVPFIMRDDLPQADYDSILIVSVYDDEISRQLTEEVGIPKEKVLRRIQWCKMLFSHKFGEMHPDRTFYLLSHPIHLRDGLFSYVFAFLEQMDFVERNGYIPVIDMQNFWSQYLDEEKVGIENAWEYYYQPFSEYSLAEVYESSNVILGYDENCYKADYDRKYDIRRMSELYEKYVRYRSDVASYIENEYEDKIDRTKKTLGVLYRGSDMSALKLKNHPVQPTVDEMIASIYQYMEEWQCEQIFVSTEDAAAMDRFRAEFGSLMSCTDQRRFGDTGQTWLANIHFERQNDSYLKGLEYLTTIELLSRCDCLVAGICTGSICAQIMNNGKYEHLQMIDKGEYR